MLAIIAILSAILLPALPRGTSRAQLESYAVDIAGLLSADRNAALRRGAEIVTQVDASARLIRSGATSRFIRMADDIDVSATLSTRCNRIAAGRAITFFPSGMSCGGAITVTRMNTGYEIRVNWLTGVTEIVPFNRS